MLLAGLLAPRALGQVGLQPIGLDEIHYYFSDRPAAIRFFQDAFGARLMTHPGKRAIGFIDFLNLRPGEPSINISPKGPFEGMAVGDPRRWQRRVVSPSPKAPPVYGVHWLGVATPSLDVALRGLRAQGVVVKSEKLRLPAAPQARAALVYGPDSNLIAIVERNIPSDPRFPFAFDHVQLLVGRVDENERFFASLYGARVVTHAEHTSVLSAGGATLVLSDPEALGLRRSEVQPRDIQNTFRYAVDHISFLYADVKPAYEAARAKGVRFPLEPATLQYFGEPTPYVFGFAFSPDGLQCEMLSEEGRKTLRHVVDEREFVSHPDPAVLPSVPLRGPGIPPGLTARVLRESPLGPRTLIVRYPPGFALGTSGYHSNALEAFVLEGALQAGPVTLRKGHYAAVPAGALIGPLSSATGATLLQYWSGPPDFVPSAAPRPGASAAQVVDSESVPWTPSTVTQAGKPPIPLLIRNLRRDPETGARTWLVAILRGVKVPWEAHSAPEEGFLVEGDYVQPECLPSGRTKAAYVPGGYFWRPARLLHSGPDETTQAYAIWLLRTPRPLDVEFFEECVVP